MDESNSNPRKRPRPVVSCLRCREKKLKCDRTAPCENCVKASTAHTCTYKRSGHMPSNEVTPVPTAAVALLEDLQLRMTKVEELLGVKPGAIAQAMDKTTQQTLGTVVVKGNRSVYHGQNDRVTLLNQFLEVKGFINGISKDEQFQASAKQIKFLQTKSVAQTASPDSINEPHFSLALSKLRECLPPKPYCDRLLAIYCNHFERTMRVLHVPTFMRQYEQLWKDINLEACSHTSIIPQITVVMTLAYHMDDAGQLSNDQAHRSYLKGSAIDIVQAWLDELSRKQRTVLSTLQIEILLLLSKSLRGMHPEKLWSSTGALVRSAMIMGLDLDPSTVADFAPYQAEMRRRLWITILEIDLQASMTTGMPLVFPEVDSQSLRPANLDDLEFDEYSASLPTSRSLNTYTDNIYQVVLASSLPQRLKALSLVQRSAPDLQEALTLGRKVEECINTKPRVVSLHNDGAAALDGGSLLHRVLLDLYIRRPVLCLYKPLLLGQSHDSPTYSEIQKHCLDYSLAILTYQNLYTVPALSVVTNSPMAHQNFFYRCCKMDVLWAALTCCQRIKVLQQEATNMSLGRQHGHNITSLVETVNVTIEYLIDRIGQKGSDLKDIAFLALALQSVQLPSAEFSNQQQAAQRSHTMQQVVKRLLAACRERLLQSMAINEQPLVGHLTERARTSPSSMLTATTNTNTPPVFNPRLTPTSLSDITFPMDISENAEQWFGDLPYLAAEFTHFQADLFNPTNALNIGITQDWSWKHMWQ